MPLPPKSQTMHTLARFSLLLAAALLASPAFAQRAVDARAFDIAGVRLGMGWEEARQSASRFMQVPPSALAPFSLNNPLTGKREPMGFRIRQPNVELAVYFTANPEANGRLEVREVKYELAWSQENAERLRQAALDKYGAPSNGLDGVVLEWCAHPNENPGLGCGNMFHPGQAEQAVLKAWNTNLELSDPRADARLERHRDAQRRAAPRF